MQLIKRAKGNAGDIVPPNMPEKDVKEEVLSRNAKAGYCTKYGEPACCTKIQAICSFDFLPTKINGKIIKEINNGSISQ
ncbi:MAG: hypothetical protein JXA96_17350 [Sedimentisphaerales bacterium]|nr:hypothetical protein [Sedimentisphaerales bacterium]